MQVASGRPESAEAVRKGDVHEPMWERPGSAVRFAGGLGFHSSARKHNPALSACRQRLIANGKKQIVAITAIMRKLVVLANAILKNINPATV